MILSCLQTNRAHLSFLHDIHHEKSVPKILGRIYGDAILATVRMRRNRNNDDIKLLKDEDGVGLLTIFISEVINKLGQIVL